MDITREMITALTDLRVFAKAVRAELYPPEMDRRAQQAVELLDNADFFTEIDMTANETEVSDQFEAGATDPAEWGDTTSADMAAHQKES